jgi:hypothetical protein
MPSITLVVVLSEERRVQERVVQGQHEQELVQRGRARLQVEEPLNDKCQQKK